MTDRNVPDRQAPITHIRELRHWLDRFGIRPSRRLGQSFLVDDHWAERIVAALDPRPEDAVLEVGPGAGALTERLARRAGRVVAIEVDRRLAAVLAERLDGAGNVHIVVADVLTLDLPRVVGLPGLHGEQPRAAAVHQERWPDHGAGPVKVISNLPYSITSPFLVYWLESNLPWERAVLTLQEEVVDRLTGRPGSKAYGALSLFVQYHARVEKLGTVRRTAFWPRPEVDSAVIRMWPHARPPVEVHDRQALWALIRAAFSRRRKHLPNALSAHPQVSPAAARRACVAAGLDPQARPEDLGLDEFARLANLLFGPASGTVSDAIRI